MKKGRLIVMTGPSGVGKGTLVRSLIKDHPELHLSVSVTTRSPREGEINGQDYYFVDHLCFQNMIERGELLEWADQEEYWTCKKCDKNIMESVYHQGKYHKGEYHKKYCNSTKEKHKHKLIPDYNTKHVKDKCCFRCGKKGHYIVDCKYPNI